MDFHTKFRAFFPYFTTIFFQHFYILKYNYFYPSYLLPPFSCVVINWKNITQYIPLQEL